jgi:hypothetical protein
LLGSLSWIFTLRIFYWEERELERPFSHHASTLAQNQIDDPAAADVRPFAAAVGEDFGVVATGVFQRVGEDREAVEGTVVVDCLGDAGCNGRS